MPTIRQPGACRSRHGIEITASCSVVYSLAPFRFDDGIGPYTGTRFGEKRRAGDHKFRCGGTDAFGTFTSTPELTGTPEGCFLENRSRAAELRSADHRESCTDTKVLSTRARSVAHLERGGTESWVAMKGVCGAFSMCMRQWFGAAGQIYSEKLVFLGSSSLLNAVHTLSICVVRWKADFAFFF
jgi:hypothetical protein